MSLDAFIETAWNEHGDAPQAVADRLAASLSLITEAAQVPPYAAIVAHVYGEHLGAWQQGIALLKSMRGLPLACDGAVLDRHAAALACAAGDEAALATLPRDDRIAALAAAGAALAGRGDIGRALTAFRAALAEADAAERPGPAALRALAVGGNNLATTLEERPGRSQAETDGMVEAAEAGLTYWRLAGTWLQEERAAYRLARSLLQAQRPAEAVRNADLCLQICERNDAPAFELFFAHAVRAMANRAAGDPRAFIAAREQALACHSRLPDDETPWCEADLALLHDDHVA